MLLQVNIQNLNELQINSMPSKTYKLNYGKNQIYDTTDDLQALQQAIYIILNTERYNYLIYSWDFGIELKKLIGMEKFQATAQLEQAIKDALLQDSRILSVENFSFAFERKAVTANFTVKTIFGDIESQKVVEI